jgi:type VI secretion system secreted protein Hcp
MAEDIFMKIDGIPGDTTDKSHPNEIKVSTWSWGSTSTYTYNSGSSGHVDIQDLHFTAKTSKASPLLFLGCATGTHAATAELTVRKPGSTPIEFLKVSMTDVLIDSYQVVGSETDDVPVDQVSLQFTKVQYKYTPQNQDGTPGTPIVGGWDRASSKKI